MKVIVLFNTTFEKESTVRMEFLYNPERKNRQGATSDGGARQSMVGSQCEKQLDADLGNIRGKIWLDYSRLNKSEDLWTFRNCPAYDRDRREIQPFVGRKRTNSTMKLRQKPAKHRNTFHDLLNRNYNKLQEMGRFV